MAAPTISPPATLPVQDTAAPYVSAEDYLAQYAADHVEWVKGEVIKMAPVSLRHDLLTHYFRQILDTYLALNPIGRVVGEPFVMRLESADSYREPDLQVILHSNPGQLTDTAMIGPADLCIEVVSPESIARDYGQKFEEYEKGGVQEYWIIDPERREARFLRRQSTGLYATMPPDDAGYYQTPLLPRLTLHVPTLWQESLPDIVATVQAVQAMLKA